MKASKPVKLSIILSGAAIALVGLVIGGFSAWHLADNPPPGGQRVSIGPWDAHLGIASASVDPWTRAYIARDGLLALTDDRVIYFWARSDSEGRPLSSMQSYHIEGSVTGQAGWWSVTAYGEDGFLMPDVSGRFSVNSVMSVAGETAIDAILGPQARDGRDWIATSGDQRIVLLFRFYDHPGWAVEDVAALPMPDIRRDGAS